MDGPEGGFGAIPANDNAVTSERAKSGITLGIIRANPHVRRAEARARGGQRSIGGDGEETYEVGWIRNRKPYCSNITSAVIEHRYAR
jgi:hypothetical protein